jgi:hypothetical protein
MHTNPVKQVLEAAQVVAGSSIKRQSTPANATRLTIID